MSNVAPDDPQRDPHDATATRNRTVRPFQQKLSQADRTAILALRIAGESVSEIAKRYSIARETVWRVCNPKQRASVRASLGPAHGIDDWRIRLKNKAIQAVESGLDATDDPYKRAGVGVRTMVGLGEFQGEGNVSLLVNMPDWACVSLDDSSFTTIDVTPTDDSE